MKATARVVKVRVTDSGVTTFACSRETLQQAGVSSDNDVESPLRVIAHKRQATVCRPGGEWVTFRLIRPRPRGASFRDTERSPESYVVWYSDYTCLTVLLNSTSKRVFEWRNVET